MPRWDSNFKLNKMKIANYLLLLFLFLFNFAFSQNENLQDVVYLKNGSIIRGLIIEQVPNKSLKIQTADKSVFVYDINEVEKITKEANQNKTEGYVIQHKIKDLDKQGRLDATKYYRGYKGAQVGTFFASLFGGPLGLIPAVSCSSTPPPEETLYNVNHPNPELFDYPEYKKGYSDKARKMKKVKTWVSFGIGMGINLVVFSAIVTAASQ